MIRKKKEIECEIKGIKEQLDSVIEGAVKRERSDDETVSLIKKELANLRSETCFEDTIEGRIQLLETTAFGEIDIILKELSAATGRSYQMKPQSNIGSYLHYNLAFDSNFDYATGERIL